MRQELLGEVEGRLPDDVLGDAQPAREAPLKLATGGNLLGLQVQIAQMLVDARPQHRAILVRSLIDIAGGGALDSAKLRDELLGHAEEVTGC